MSLYIESKNQWFSVDVGHLRHLHLVCAFDYLCQPLVILLQADDSLAEASDLIFAVVVVGLERLFVDNACLLFEFLVFLLEHLPFLLHVGQALLLLVELVVESLERIVLRGILLLDVLEFLAGVRQYHHRVRYLLAQLVQLLVSLLDLLVEGLVLDLKLLEVDQVKAVRQLLLLLQNFLFIR